jgi:hypothetical protein
MPTRTSTLRQNGHAGHRQIGSIQELCPYCLSPIAPSAVLSVKRRVEAEEKRRDASLEAMLRQQFSREQQQAQRKAKADITKAVSDATAVMSRKVELLRANREAMITAKVAAEREAGAKRFDAALQAAKLEHATEKLKLETALSDLTRRVQAKPPHAVGPPAEKSLHDEIAAILSDVAPLDRVSRVGPGVRGADVLVEVVTDNGETAGKIIIESKAVSRWSSSYTRVLRGNQIREAAAFGILSTTTMPANCREVAVVDNTIVCAPERVPVMVAILRRIVLDNFVQRLGAEERDDKASRLYSFVLSKACDDMFDTLLRLGRDLTELDAAQSKSNQQIFAKRAKLIRGVLDVREQFVAVVADIVGGGQ